MPWTGHENDTLTDEQMHRMIGGRRRVNALRQMRAIERRVQVAALLRQGQSQAEIARRLGFHRSTICRDALVLVEMAKRGRCPICGRGSSDD